MPEAWNKPFREQSEFFRRKLALPSKNWDDLLRDEHDAGFIVAGAMKADLVADLKAAVQKVIDEGGSIGAFRKDFDRIVKARGWEGWTGSDSKVGISWRTRVIYNTNLRASFSAGRYAQMTDPDVLKARPYWRYVHRSAEHPRLQHQAWNGVTLPAQDPWFDSRWPPNGFGCQCKIDSVTEREMTRSGGVTNRGTLSGGERLHLVKSTGELVKLPQGVDYGWDYTPGKSAAQNALAARLNRLDSMDEAVARLNVRQLVTAPIFSRFFRGQINGEFPIATLAAADKLLLGADSSVVLLSQESLAAHAAKHPEITLGDYRKIQSILDTGEVYKQGDARLIYITLDGISYRAALKRTADGRKNYFLTLFRNDSGAKPKADTRVR